jgi:hypothetical protein
MQLAEEMKCMESMESTTSSPYSDGVESVIVRKNPAIFTTLESEFWSNQSNSPPPSPKLHFVCFGYDFGIFIFSLMRASQH